MPKAKAATQLDPRTDAYIAKAAPFAQPILTHIRELVHKSLPDVEEAIKWSMPFFMYRGIILGNIAALAYGMRMLRPRAGRVWIRAAVAWAALASSGL